LLGATGNTGQRVLRELLAPGVHGPVAALGLEALRHGDAESGGHEVAGPSSCVEVSA
jgi:uncharacterized protein YbjT (DUF2867 family)